jgi:hypothetical protein
MPRQSRMCYHERQNGKKKIWIICHSRRCAAALNGSGDVGALIPVVVRTRAAPVFESRQVHRALQERPLF